MSKLNTQIQGGSIHAHSALHDLTVSATLATATLTSHLNLLTGTVADERIEGAGEGDYMFGREGNDSLIGNGGEDFLAGGKGNDSLTGGAGKDIFAFGAEEDLGNAERDVVADFEAGIDRLSISNPAGTRLDFAQVGGNVEIRLDTGAVIEVRNATLEEVKASIDLVSKPVFSLDPFNPVKGTEGNDDLTGTAGRDEMLGSDGDDRLNGGAGADILLSGTGNDSLTGGDGDDQFIFASLEKGELDIVTDFQVGDRLSFGFSADKLTTMAQIGDDVRIDFAGGGAVLLQNALLGDVQAATDWGITLDTSADSNPLPDPAPESNDLITPIVWVGSAVDNSHIVNLF